MKTANTASLVHLNDVVCLTVSNNISHMGDFEQRFNISQNKVNNAPLQFLPQIETSFHFQDMCPYRLPIGTSPTQLRKLSKGPAPSNDLKNSNRAPLLSHM
jgi:hypothetical protein